MTTEQRVLENLHQAVDENFVINKELTARKQRPVFTTKDLEADFLDNTVTVMHKDGTVIQQLFVPNNVVTDAVDNTNLREAKRQLMLACENLRQVIAGEADTMVLAKAKRRMTIASEALNNAILHMS